MQQTKPPFRADHVGSLLRPAALKQAREKRAKGEIEDHTHRRVDFIAWPFGDYNTDLIRLAAKLGFYAMIDTEYGVNRPGDSVMKIKRLRLSSANDTLRRFEAKLAQYGLR